MRKVFKVAAIMAVTAMVLAAPVFAQQLLDPLTALPNSPQTAATAGVFKGDADNSMSVLRFGQVDFDKGFVFIGTSDKWTQYPSRDWNWLPMPSLGWASKFGALYVGVNYFGNINSFNNGTEEIYQVSKFSENTQLPTTKTIQTEYSGTWSEGTNSIQALVGLTGLNMGIKLGFYEDLKVMRKDDDGKKITTIETYGSDKVTKTNEMLDFSRAEGNLLPSLEWGMGLNLGSIALSPYFGFGLNIYQDYKNVSFKGIEDANEDYVYDYDKDGVLGPENIKKYARNSGSLEPRFKIGAEVGLGDMTFGLGYGLNIGTYNNKYDAGGFSGTVKGEIGWYDGSTTITKTLQKTETESNVYLNVTEKSTISHMITPSFRLDKEFDERLKFGITASIPISFGSSSYNYYEKGQSTIVTTYNDGTSNKRSEEEWKKVEGYTYVERGDRYWTEQYGDVSTGFLATTNNSGDERNDHLRGLYNYSDFGMKLNVGIGATYQLIPNRFSINAGVKLAPVNFTRTSMSFTQGSTSYSETKREYDAQGNLIHEEKSATPRSEEQPNNNNVTDYAKTSFTWNGFIAEASGGFTFNFNEKLSVDMAVNGGGSTSNDGAFRLNLTNVKVLFSLKY